MTYIPNRRELLVSGAALASAQAIGSYSLSGGVTNAATGSAAAAPAAQIDAYMGAPVEMATAPNGAIARKKLLDGIGKVGWLEPTIEKPAEGI